MTRLDFLAGLGMLDVDIEGQLIERETPFGFDRLQARYAYLSPGGEEVEESAHPGEAEAETDTDTPVEEAVAPDEREPAEADENEISEA